MIFKDACIKICYYYTRLSYTKNNTKAATRCSKKSACHLLPHCPPPTPHAPMVRPEHVAPALRAPRAPRTALCRCTAPRAHRPAGGGAISRPGPSDTETASFPEWQGSLGKSAPPRRRSHSMGNATPEQTAPGPAGGRRGQMSGWKVPSTGGLRTEERCGC